MGIKAIIVDDVDLARQRIRMLLDDEEIEIVGEAANGRQAIGLIQELQPDLVFLDIQMPKIGGFEVIEQVGVENMPAVIFVTAYDEFALQAFEINAVDYLLKPFDKDRLKVAVQRAKREIGHEIPSAEIEERLRRLISEIRGTPKYLKRIPVKQKDGTTLVSVNDIDWIAASGPYLELHTELKTYLVREKISEVEIKLDPERFARIHRSIILNIDRVKTLHPLFNGDHLIILKDGTELNLSRTYHKRLISVLTGE
jgi:two-component system LytT family response regulator